MADKTAVLEMVRRQLEYPGADVDRAEEIYHEDAVLEFPQSGERFEGRDRFTEWRSQYPAEVTFQIQRITAREDLAVVELTAQYDDGPTMYGVGLSEFRGNKIARERIYVMEGWEAPDWRTPWRSENPSEEEPA